MEEDKWKRGNVDGPKMEDLLFATDTNSGASGVPFSLLTLIAKHFCGGLG